MASVLGNSLNNSLSLGPSQGRLRPAQEGLRVAYIEEELSRFNFVGYTPVGYSPFKTPVPSQWQESLAADLKLLRQTWTGLISYGMGGVLADVPEQAAANGFTRLLLGVFDVTSEEELDAAEAAVSAYPGMIRSICLGNEGLCYGRYDLAALERAFRRIRSAHPRILLTTSEPIFAWGEKRLLELVDFCAPIIHPWIHCERLMPDPCAAAIWVIQAAQRLQVLSGKPVFVKETGFPANGVQLSTEHQREFWDVLMREAGALSRKVHVASFEAFDNPEKMTFSAPLEWDNHWGLFDEHRRPKAAFFAIQQYLVPPAEVSSVSTDGDSVSVVVAATRATYLPRAIESVLDQSHPPRRLIIVDDYSRTDAVRETCRRYAAYRGLKYVRRNMEGSAGTARNEGFRHVDTPYVCFLDDDDVFLADKLRSQLQLLDSRPEIAGVATAAEVIDGAERRIGRSGYPIFFPGAPLASMLAFCQYIHSSVMLRSDVLHRHGGFREFYRGEDWELWCRLHAAGLSFAVLPRVLAQYRRHGENCSTSSYVREAAQNILDAHLGIPSERLVYPLPYSIRSGDLIKAAILIMHGKYSRALDHLDGLELTIARIARHICYRELADYTQAWYQIAPLATTAVLRRTVQRRLEIHGRRFPKRAQGVIVGSAALLMEQRLLARDALAASTGSPVEPDILQYFAPNPTNINIEDGDSDVTEEIFFSRVSLTSC